MQKHYIENFILQSQMKYPPLFEDPLRVLSHLLFTNGNGKELLDGNFVQHFEYGSVVPFSEYFKHSHTFEQISSYQDDRDFDREVDSLYKSKLEVALMVAEYTQAIIDEDALYQESVDEFNSRFDEMGIVSNYTLKELLLPKTYLAMFKGRKYAPSLDLSPKYYKAYYFDQNTCKTLVGVSLACTVAYIEYLKTLTTQSTDNESLLNTLESPRGGEVKDLIPLYKRDIKELYELKDKLEELQINK